MVADKVELFVRAKKNLKNKLKENSSKSKRLVERAGNLAKHLVLGLESSAYSKVHSPQSKFNKVLNYPIDSFALASHHWFAFWEDLLALCEKNVGLQSQATPPEAAITLQGVPGQTCESAFVIENSHEHRVDFSLVPVLNENEAIEQGAYQLQFQPDKASLEPGDKVTVRLFAKLDVGLKSGAYYTQVCIDGFENRVFGVSLEVSG